MVADAMVETAGGKTRAAAGAAGTPEASDLAPWSTQSVMILICSFESMSLGGIWLPLVSEMRCTSRLPLEFPGMMTRPELLPDIAPAAVSRCKPAEADGPMWQAAQVLKIG